MGIRVGLNLLHAMPEIGGVWNYLANLISALDQNDDDYEYIAFVTDASKHLLRPKSRIKTVYINIRPISRGQRILFENTGLQYLAHYYSLDCIHWFANTRSLLSVVPSVVTIYDLLVFRNSQVFSLIKRLYLVNMMKFTARSASVLLPMSNFTASDLKRFLGVRPNRIIVIPTIIPAEFSKASESVIKSFKIKYHLPDKFWVYVAHTYKHKNHKRLLEAYSQAKLKGLEVWPLVLRGEASDAELELIMAIQKLELDRHIIRLPRLDYGEMPVLYSAARALIFPSLFEGGGIPVLEAMACGCPVVGSDIPPIRDSANDAALYFDPTDVGSIRDSIYRLQTDDILRNQLSRKGIERSKEFQQQKVVSDLHVAYQTAYGK
jgi:glycosyltransferase involved in cell wall biosynthesis